jgi:DNA-directed RNA polymerase specialized sigma24 family protein
VEDTLQLVHRILNAGTGDPAAAAAAWTSLQAALDPLILRIIRGHRDLRRKGLADQPDDVADVRTAALERLASQNFQNLRNFITRSADSQRPDSLEAWLYGVVDYAIRDHLRKRFGRAPKQPAAHGAVIPSKRDLQSYAGRLDMGTEPARDLLSEVGVTTRLTLAEVRAFIVESFSPQEVKAVELYYSQGQDYAELAKALALPTPKHAEQLIRRINARLRYRFAPAG